MGISGGGISNNGSTASLTLNNSTVSGNVASSGGGGISNNGSGGTITLTNVTVTGNTAGSGGGGIFAFAGTLALTNVTVSDNTGTAGSGGISNVGAAVTLVNTIGANNLGGDCSGAITSLGHNLDGDGSCGLSGPGDLSGVDPILGPLADNGGPTFTHALLPASMAIHAGDDTAAPATDQRGFPRFGPSDIGAFEVQPVSTNDIDGYSNLPPDYLVCQGPCPGGYFNDAVEAFMGTDPFDRCPPADDVSFADENIWPPDFNGNGSVNLLDVFAIRPVFGTASGDGTYLARFDLNASGNINLLDVFILRPFFGLTCTLPS